MKVDLTAKELFLIEMALDQALYSIPDIESPIYKRFEEVDIRMAKIRRNAELSEEVKNDIPAHRNAEMLP